MNVRHLALVTMAMLAAPVAAHAQYRGVRFEITRVGDSTFAFPIGGRRSGSGLARLGSRWIPSAAMPSAALYRGAHRGR